MEVKGYIVFEFEKDGRKYLMLSPNECPLGDLYEASVSFLGQGREFIDKYVDEVSAKKDKKDVEEVEVIEETTE